MSLLAHYRLNGNANDSSGNGLNGAPTDISWVAGKIGQAASFNGSTSYVDCSSRFAPTGDATFCCWIKPTMLSSGQRFVSQLGNNAGDMLLRVLDTSGKIRFVRWNGVGETIQYWTTTAAVVANQWNFVCATYSAGTVTIRINETTETPSMSSVVSAHVQENLKFGGDSDGKFAGLIDDLRLYDEALSESKIEAIYNNSDGTEGTVFGPHRCQKAQTACTGANAGESFAAGAVVGQTC